MLRRLAMGQDLSPAIRSAGASEQAKMGRTAASRFLRTLTSERQARVVFPFPQHGQFATIETGGPQNPRALGDYSLSIPVHRRHVRACS
jgi:hypothetical protein